MAAPGLAQVLSRRASVPPPGKGGHRGRPREDRPHRSGRRRGERARRRVVVRSASALADAAATTPETRNMAFTSSSAKTSRGAPSNGHHAEQDLMDDRSSSPEPVFYSSVKSEKATRHSKRTDAADSGNGEETDKRKRPMRFTGQHDIQLLQEVVNLNPFKDTPPTTTWASISKNLERLFMISSRRCRERTILMLDQFIKGDYPSLQRFCTKEEFTIKEQLLQQVLQQYEDGAGGYSSRIGGGIVAAAAAAADEDNDDDDEFDLDKIRPRVILHDGSTPEHYTSRQGDSEPDHANGVGGAGGGGGGNGGATASSAPAAKRLRVADDDLLLEDMMAASSDGRPADFPTQVVTFLLSRQAKEMRVREKELKLRREELDLERAKLKLQEDRHALEKARFEIERQERELRLRSEKQERTLFMEVLKKVISTGLADS
ncbi:uncharacterized protein LOC8053753 [Ixodes scapularis]|nr:uncharacterized protein LOC8053753 [Ixodes scapularis]